MLLYHSKIKLRNLWKYNTIYKESKPGPDSDFSKWGVLAKTVQIMAEIWVLPSETKGLAVVAPER